MAYGGTPGAPRQTGNESGSSAISLHAPWHRRLCARTDCALAARSDIDDLLRLFAAAIDSTQDGVVITDAGERRHQVVYVNPSFTRITGWRSDEIIGQDGRLLLRKGLRRPEIKTLRRVLNSRSDGHVVMRCRRKDGQEFWNELHVAPIRNSSNTITHYATVIADVSERVRRENQLTHLATHDPLTGLANRTLLQDRLQQSLLRALRDGRLVALLLIDLDRFKQINDTLGHSAGDLLLQAVAERLSTLAREGDTVARLGGDEFVLLLTDVSDAGIVPRMGQLVLERLAPPIYLGSDEICMTPSVGAAVFPRDAVDAENLLRLADVAMYKAKESGRNAFRAYASTMCSAAQERLVLERDLRHALEREELSLHYQPKLDLHSGRISGVEALLRWHSPRHGSVPPGRFVALAESSGQIVAIGEWALREACRAARAWQEQGAAGLRVAVNLSAAQLRRDDFVAHVDRILAETGVAPAGIEFEVTESMVMEDPDTADLRLRQLKRLGIRLTMDDFGTGFSSLGYLKRFPFDALKIDRSFVQNIVREPDDALIALAIIAMAHSLGLHVVAEGVEEACQMHFLARHHCDELQGYFFSPPLPAADLLPFLRRPPSPIARPPRNDGSDRTLLVVDSDAARLAALSALLAPRGYRVLTAASAIEAFELLAMNSIRVVIAEELLPGTSGCEFLRRIKAMYPHAGRVLIAARDASGAPATPSDAAGTDSACRVVGRPWNEDELAATILDAFFDHTRTTSTTLGRDPS